MESIFDQYLKADSDLEIETILDSGQIDFNATDHETKNILMRAAELGLQKWVAALLKRGIKIETKDAINNNALIYATMSGNLPCIKLLIEAGASPQVKTSDNENLLIILVNGNISNKVDAVRYLLLHVQNIDETDRLLDKSALDYALRVMPQTIQAELVKKSILKNYPDNKLTRVAIWGSMDDLNALEHKNFSLNDWNNALKAARDSKRSPEFIKALRIQRDAIFPEVSKLRWLTLKYWANLIIYPFIKLQELFKAPSNKSTSEQQRLVIHTLPTTEQYDLWDKRGLVTLYQHFHKRHQNLVTLINDAARNNDQKAYSNLNAELNIYEQDWNLIWLPFSRGEMAAFQMAVEAYLKQLENGKKALSFEKSKNYTPLKMIMKRNARKEVEAIREELKQIKLS